MLSIFCRVHPQDDYFGIWKVSGMASESENLFRQQTIQKYRVSFDKLFRYIPWLMQNQGRKTSHMYQGDNMPNKSIPIAVYDSTLLAFVKEMQATGLMDRNYVYVLSRNSLRTEQDELNWIEQAELRNIEDIFGIMSKYVLGGMTKGYLWTQAVENGVFLQSLLKVKKLLEVWDNPLA